MHNILSRVMKKCFIAILIVFSIVNNTNSEELKNKFYVVGDLGLINNSTKLEDDTYNSMKKIKPTGLEVKSNHGLVGSIGLGYKFTDNIRFDFKVGSDKADYHYKPNSSQELDPISDITTHKAEKRSEYTKDIKIEARDLDFSINGYYDFSDLFRGIKPFILVGVGVTNKKVKTEVQRITSVTKVEHFVTNNSFCHNPYLEDKNKVSNYFDNIKYGEDKDEIVETEESSAFQPNETHVYKSKLNPFYTLGLGASFTHEDTPNTTIDLTYKFKKNLRDNFKEGGVYNKKIKSHSHYFVMGIRYHF